MQLSHKRDGLTATIDEILDDQWTGGSRRVHTYINGHAYEPGVCDLYSGSHLPRVSGVQCRTWLRLLEEPTCFGLKETYYCEVSQTLLIKKCSCYSEGFRRCRRYCWSRHSISAFARIALSAVVRNADLPMLYIASLSSVLQLTFVYCARQYFLFEYLKRNP